MAIPKIYYKVEESEYKANTRNLIFYFSSQFYMQNFLNRLISNREELHYKLSSRFNIEINANDYFDIILYSQIEKRGFHIVDKNSGGVFTCLKEVILNGEIRINLNYKEPSKTSMQK